MTALSTVTLLGGSRCPLPAKDAARLRQALDTFHGDGVDDVLLKLAGAEDGRDISITSRDELKVLEVGFNKLSGTSYSDEMKALLGGVARLLQSDARALKPRGM